MTDLLAITTLVTYGGGEYLSKVFDAVAMLVNGHSESFIRPVAMLCAGLCFFYAFTKAFFSYSVEVILRSAFFPFIFVTMFLMVPTTTVKIDDILVPSNSRTVDNVPLLLGKFSSFASTASYKLTEVLESVLHSPGSTGKSNDYEKTGMIFGADAAIDLNRFKIINGDLEHNLRQFSKQCILYDITLGKYSIDDVKKSTDLWEFFAENTSKVRMIKYSSPESNSSDKFVYKTCKEAIIDMQKLLGKEVEYYEKVDIVKNIPLTFQALTKLSSSQSEIIGQQLMMQMLANEFDGTSFAKGRADAHQKSFMNIMGSLASNTIIGTRIALECLIYLSFVLILPLAYLPQGYHFVGSWGWLVLWIHTWPPFFVLINYIMLITAKSQSEMIFVEGGERGLSFFTNVGIQNIQDQVFAIGGFLAASVPYITYMFLKGGIHAVGSLSHHISSPLSSAASIAASEETTGNYSFGNANMNNSSYQNESAYQTNVAPSLRSGLISANDSTSSVTYSPDEWNINQGDSNTRMNFSYDEANSRSLSEVVGTSQASTLSHEKAYTEAASSHVRNTANLVESLSKAESYTNSASQAEAYDIQKSASDSMSIAERYGKSVGMSTRDSLDLLTSVSAGLDVGFAGAKASTNTGSMVDTNNSLSSALDIVENSDFRTNLQNVQNYAKNHSASSLTDEAQRIAFDYSKSSDQMQSTQEAYRTSLNTTNQLSENAAWLDQVSQHVKYNQTQEFANWLVDNDVMSYGEFSRVTSNGGDSERVELLNLYADFNRDKHASLVQNPVVDNYQSPSSTHEQSRDSVPQVDYSTSKSEVQSSFDEMRSSNNFISGGVAQQREQISNTFDRVGDHGIENKLVLREHNLDVSQKDVRNQTTEENKTFLAKRMLNHSSDQFQETFGLKNKKENNFTIKEQPFWHKGYDE